MNPITVRVQDVVALTWVLKDSLGEELDVLDEAVEFFVGGDDLLPRIDEALVGKKVGDTVELALEPTDAFGDYDEGKVFLQDRSLFAESLQEGETIPGSSLPAGCTDDMPADGLYTVTEIYPEHVVLDGNHPLAGIGLRLRLRVEGVREASPEEVGSGTAGSGFFKLG